MNYFEIFRHNTSFAVFCKYAYARKGDEFGGRSIFMLNSKIDPAAIHATAVVAPSAIIGADTVIGPYSVIGERVRIGCGNRIGSHVVIEGHTVIGDGNTIYQFASIGAAPQDLKFHGEDTVLLIGDRNIIREYVTLQPGTEGGGGQTVIGNGNLFMACSHVAHDCLLGDDIRMGNSTGLAGHIEIGDGAILSALAGVHQFVRIGRQAFVSGGAIVTQDVPPYCLAQGDRAHLVGLNLTGLQRGGMSEEEIAGLKRTYRILFHGGGLLEQRLATAAAQTSEYPSANELARFVASSERGIVSARKMHKAA
jgi:UDP-N-acetylglucosamine acyltransferase